MKPIEKLKIELETNKRKDVIESYEEIIAEYLQHSPLIDDLFSLPLNNILNIVSKTTFPEEKATSQIKSLISKTLSAYPEETGTILLLSSLHTKNLDLNLDSCIDILSLFKQCDICSQLKILYQDFKQLPSIDSDQIQLQDKEIYHLKHELDSIQSFFEKDIFIASKEGDLSSVKYLIQHKGVDVNIIAETRKHST